MYVFIERILRDGNYPIILFSEYRHPSLNESYILNHLKSMIFQLHLEKYRHE